MRTRIRSTGQRLAALGIGATVMLGALAAAPPAAHAAPALAEPSLSPDGREVAFVSGGDIWTAPAEGGEARLLVADPATESRPLWSPDGARLAFLSNRGGPTNIYVLTLASGLIRRLTYADAQEQLDGWSRDGRWVYFSSGVDDIDDQNDIFRVSAEGGTPLEVSRERFLNEFQAAPSPDGTRIALMARGLSDLEWWRNGHSHIDETEIWLKPLAEGTPYARLAPGGAKHAFPMWSPDGARLYFMSDESGAENIWVMDAQGGPARPITHFTGGRVLWPSIAYDGRAIVFERDFAVWRLDLASGVAAPLAITPRGAPAAAGERRLTETGFSDLALSPDGRKVAVIAHGEVFAASSAESGPAQRLTRSAGAKTALTWSPDSRRLLYSAERGIGVALALYDFDQGAETTLAAGPLPVTSGAWSPDGKSVAYVRGGRELHVMGLGAGATDRVIFTGAVAPYDPSPPAWSPDGQWLAFAVVDAKGFRNLWVAPAAGGTARQITFLANGEGGPTIAWSPDGAFLLFDTAQRSEPVRLARVDLTPHAPPFREDAFRALFKPPEQAAKTDAKAPPAAAVGPKPVRIVFEGIGQRITLLPLGMSAENPVISPDGKTLVYAARLGERSNLYSYSLDELAPTPPSPAQLTSTENDKTDVAFTSDSKTVFYRDDGKLFSTALDAPRARALALTAELDVSFDKEKQVVFDEAWSILDRRFVDPNFNGRDWTGLRAKFQPWIDGARNGAELRRVINLMIGELNASHSGVDLSRAAAAAAAPRVSRAADIGLRFDREAFEAGQGLKVREVIALGPAAIEGTIRPGERLLAVDGETIGPHDNLDQRLLGKADRRVTLQVADATGKTREAVVRPITTHAAADLLYRQWVNERRAYVERISGGRLGYVHLADMTGTSLAQLYIDLDAANQLKRGVVIDVRNNEGGFVNGYALDVFARRNFLVMTPRTLSALPNRNYLGQRALGLPTVLVTNESTLSDGEDFTEGYRALGLGKVVGQPTAGWIIYTGVEPLIDGSYVRRPSTRVQDLKGVDMEMHPRPVDLPVERPLGETLTGRDAQLDAAVKVLLDALP